MKKKIFKPRYYQHIDKVIDIKDVEKKIKNKYFVINHGFYPFLSYTIEFDKVDAKMHWLFYCFLNFISKSLFIKFLVIVIDFLNDLTFFWY